MTELVRTIYKSCTRIHNTLQFQVIFTINMAVNKLQYSRKNINIFTLRLELTWLMLKRLRLLPSKVDNFLQTKIYTLKHVS